MSEKIRWGILGPGNISRKFAAGLAFVEDAELVAVGSRSEERAKAFAEEFEAPRAHEGYDELVADPDVDVIYIGTPHTCHAANTVQCLEAGKAVLCEKPFAINATQAAEMIRVAREKGVFLMEAMWSRFVPPIVRLREMLAEEALGEVRVFAGDFGFRCGWNPEGRLLNPELGGGGLLDVDIYPISLASMILGKPERISGMAHLGETGVDEQAAVVMGYDAGKLAVIMTGVQVMTPHEATIMGTKKRIRLHHGWWRGSEMTIYEGRDAVEQIDIPTEGNGYNYEAAEVGACLRAGTLESDVMPLDETLAIMETLDEIRAQWGLKYPME